MVAAAFLHVTKPKRHPVGLAVHSVSNAALTSDTFWPGSTCHWRNRCRKITSTADSTSNFPTLGTSFGQWITLHRKVPYLTDQSLSNITCRALSARDPYWLVAVHFVASSRLTEGPVALRLALKEGGSSCSPSPTIKLPAEFMPFFPFFFPSQR